MKKTCLSILSAVVLLLPLAAYAQPEHTIFDDKTLLEGYAKKYSAESKNVLLEMIKDQTLSPYRTAAAVRVLRERFSAELFGSEKATVEKILLTRFNRTDSKFVEIEIIRTLCQMDRYQYFKSMVPLLIQRLDHYNNTVNELSYTGLMEIIDLSSNRRPREARVVFNTLRNFFFLSRKKLQNIKEPGLRLKQKLELLRWSVKILGNQELKRLPSEVVSLLY